MPTQISAANGSTACSPTASQVRTTTRLVRAKGAARDGRFTRGSRWREIVGRKLILVLRQAKSLSFYYPVKFPAGREGSQNGDQQDLAPFWLRGAVSPSPFHLGTQRDWGLRVLASSAELPRLSSSLLHDRSLSKHSSLPHALWLRGQHAERIVQAPFGVHSPFGLRGRSHYCALPVRVQAIGRGRRQQAK